MLALSGSSGLSEEHDGILVLPDPPWVQRRPSFYRDWVWEVDSQPLRIEPTSGVILALLNLYN